MSQGTASPPLSLQPESVEASRPVVRVAGFWSRTGAFVVDGICLAPALALLGWLAFKAGGIRLPSGAELRLESVLELVLDGGGLVHGLTALAVVIILLYGFLFTVTTGATPGHRLLGLRVINIYGEAPESWRVLLRCLGFLVGAALLGLGLVWVGFDREKRGLHDLVAGTYVIRGRTSQVAEPATS